MPVFFESGGAAQLIFGLIVCFITFGLYTYFTPYDEPHVNLLAQACQCQIFFALLTSIALKFAAVQTKGQGESLIDIVLVVLTFVPSAVVFLFQTPARDIFYPEKRAKWFGARGDKEDSAAASRDNQQSTPPATRLSSTPAESNIVSTKPVNDNQPLPGTSFKSSTDQSFTSSTDESFTASTDQALASSVLALPNDFPIVVHDHAFGDGVPYASARCTKRRPSHLLEDDLATGSQSQRGDAEAPPSLRGTRNILSDHSSKPSTSVALTSTSRLSARASSDSHRGTQVERLTHINHELTQRLRAAELALAQMTPAVPGSEVPNSEGGRQATAQGHARSAVDFSCLHTDHKLSA